MQPQTGVPAPVVPPMGQPPMAGPPMGQVPLQPAPQMPLQPPQPMQPMVPQKKWFNSKYSKWLFVALFAVVGGLATYLIFAQTNNSTQYLWASQRYQEVPTDGQAHINPADCYITGNICHNNGSLVSTGSQTRVWQSDPKKNNIAKLTSATWHGPYDYSSGVYNGSGFSVTGNQQACFYMRDVGTGSALITLRVQNMAVTSNNQDQNLVTVEGSLDRSFKDKFLPVCVSYFSPKETSTQQYMVYVKEGTVQIDYVDHLTQYLTQSSNSYPYDYFSKTIQLKSKNTTNQTYAICSAKLSKSTSHCLSASELSGAAANNRLTDIQLNPPNQD